MEKLPNWLRYVIAIPYGLILTIIIGFLINLSITLFSEPNSLYATLVSFAYKNGINVLVLFYGINNILPKHKIKVTITISIIIGALYSAIQGMSIITNTMTIEYIIAYIEFIGALIFSCYLSYKGEFNN